MQQRISTMLALSVLVLLQAQPADAAKRAALVIGNSGYEHAAHLRNPRNDAEAIAASLGRLGFEVVKGIDLTRSEMVEAANEFQAKATNATVALFFYAGHGLQVDGRNYLAPIDARLKNETGLRLEMIPLNTILDVMESEERINLVFLDACRDNPLARNLALGTGTRSIRIGRGLARVEFGLASIESGVGMMIAFATQPGNVALDGEGRHSPFTAALVRHIETPGLDVADLMRKVRLDVLNHTKRRQVPWDHSSLTGPFVFAARSVEAEPMKPVAAPAAPQMPDPAAQAWAAVKDSKSRAVLETFIRKFPDATYAEFARARANELQRLETERAAALGGTKLKEGKPLKKERDCFVFLGEQYCE